MVNEHSEREKTRCRHMSYSFRLAARFFLYAPSHRHYSTYHGLCYTSRGALAGTRNSSMGSPHEGSIRRSITPRGNALTTELHLAPMPATNQVILDDVLWDAISIQFRIFTVTNRLSVGFKCFKSKIIVSIFVTKIFLCQVWKPKNGIFSFFLRMRLWMYECMCVYVCM